MLPWAHAAFGYLVYSAYSRWRAGHPPIGLTVFALGFGTQFPDLVDKPLAWSVGLLPYGRSLGHSLFTVIGLLLLLNVLFRYPDQRALITAFGVGHISHIIGDGVVPALTGDYAALGYVFWPVTNIPEGESRSFIEFILSLELTPIVLGGLLLTVAGGLVWFCDGLPGVKDLFLVSKEKTEIVQED